MSIEKLFDQNKKHLKEEIQPFEVETQEENQIQKMYTRLKKILNYLNNQHKYAIKDIWNTFSYLIRIIEDALSSGIINMMGFMIFMFHCVLGILVLYGLFSQIFEEKKPPEKSTQEHHIKIPSGTFSNGLGSPEAFVENLNAPTY
jgi:nitrate reductase NapE component